MSHVNQALNQCSPESSIGESVHCIINTQTNPKSQKDNYCVFFAFLRQITNIPIECVRTSVVNSLIRKNKHVECNQSILSKHVQLQRKWRIRSQKIESS